MVFASEASGERVPVSCPPDSQLDFLAVEQNWSPRRVSLWPATAM
jgi:hypothetical protein